MTRGIIQFFMAVMSVGFIASCLTLTTAGEGTTSTGGTETVACSTVEDCPNVTICTTMKCLEGSCVPGFVPAGLQCNDNRVCDGAGACVRCIMDDDCSGSSPSCVNNECISCSDGDKNGDETGVDCGGSKCEPCLGMPCTSPSDCETTYCVDGVCCDTPCAESCKTCNGPGKVGQCSYLATGAEDPGVCDMTQACGGLDGCLLKNGQPCTSDAQCLSKKCLAGQGVCGI